MKIKPRERVFILAGVIIIAAVAIFYALTSLLPDGKDLAQTVDFKKRMLLKQRETLGYEETYKKRMEQYKQRIEKDMKLLLPGDNPNLAGAELQKLLKEFADKSGVDITQKNILRENKVQDTLTKISVRIDTKCDPEQLVNFLTSIENYNKFLKIEEFTITRQRRRSEIRPSLTVIGYISTPEPKPKEKTSG